MERIEEWRMERRQGKEIEIEFERILIFLLLAEYKVPATVILSDSLIFLNHRG